MSKYNKIEVLKIVVFWMLAIGVLGFIITSILAVSSISYDAILAVFIVSVIFVIPSGLISIIIWFNKVNKKITNNKKETV